MTVHFLYTKCCNLVINMLFNTKPAQPLGEGELCWEYVVRVIRFDAVHGNKQDLNVTAQQCYLMVTVPQIHQKQRQKTTVK